MRFFIAYAISGETKTYLHNLTKEISERFQTWPLHEKIPPHITLYRPFDVEDLGPIRSILTDMRGVVGANFALSGFNHFDDKVVFVDVEVDISTKNMVSELRKKFQLLPDMRAEDFPDWHPHATIANHLPREKILSIWDYVSTLEKPHFTLPFDNVSIFRFVGDKKWDIEESYPTESW